MSDKDKTRNYNETFKLHPDQAQRANEYLELISALCNEYRRAAENYHKQGKKNKASRFNGIADGLMIAWDHFKVLESGDWE